MIAPSAMNGSAASGLAFSRAWPSASSMSSGEAPSTTAASFRICAASSSVAPLTAPSPVTANWLAYVPEKPACEFQYESCPARTFTSSTEQPRMSATTWAAVVSWLCPCGVVPRVTTTSPKRSSLTVATSLLPENCRSGLISRDCPKLFVPESRVEPIPSPSSFPRRSASARRHLRPDNAAERLVPQPGARVIEGGRAEAEQGAVVLDRDLRIDEPALVPVRHREVEVRPPLRPLDGAIELPREQAAGDELRVGRDLVAEAAAYVLRDEAELVEADPHRRSHHDRREARELVVRDDRPLAGAAVVLDERAVALERRRVEPVEVELRDLDHPVGLGKRPVDVAPFEDAFPRQVGSRLVVKDRRVVVDRAPGVVDGRQRLVVDLDQLGSVPRALAGLGDDRRDRLADEAGLADREAVVLEGGPRRRGDLEERIGEGRDLVAGQRPVDPGVVECRRDVDRADLGVRVRRADEVDVAHVVPLDVVEENAFALNEPLVLLTRDVLAAPLFSHRLFDNGLLRRDGRLAHSPISWPEAALIALTMFQYPVQRQMLPWIPFAISSSEGLGFSRSSAVALISMPGVQYPHCSAWWSLKACWRGLSSPSPSPSTVSIDDPSAWTARSMQLFTSVPSRMTLQAPQLPVSQPTWEPVRSRSSRIRWISRRRGSTSRSYLVPLTSTVILLVPAAARNAPTQPPALSAAWVAARTATTSARARRYAPDPCTSLGGSSSED